MNDLIVRMWRGRVASLFALCFGAALTAGVSAKEPPVSYEILFPSQGVKIGEDAEIHVAGVATSSPWQSGVISITAIDALKEINPDSDPKSVAIPRETAIAPGTATGLFRVPLKVTAAGEFGLRVMVRVIGADGAPRAFTTAVSILAEDGQVWFGFGSISSAAANRIHARAGSVDPARGIAAVPADPAEMKRWAEERQRRQLANKNRQPR